MAIRIPIITDLQDKGIRDAKKAFGDFKTSVANAEGGMNKFKAGTKSVFDSVKANAGTFAIAGAAAFAAFAAKGIKAFQDLAIASGKFADATGLAVDQASRWIEVSGDIGVGSDSIQTGINKMNKALGTTPQLFSDLSIEVAKTNTGAMDVNGTFLNVIDKLHNIKDPAERAKVATQLLGKGWMDMAELINTGSDRLKSSLAGVSDAKTISPAELQRAKDYRAAQDNLKDTFEDLSITLGEKLVPVLTTVVDNFAKIAGAKAPGGGSWFGHISDAAGLFVNVLTEGPIKAFQEYRTETDDASAATDEATDALTEQEKAAKLNAAATRAANMATAALTTQMLRLAAPLEMVNYQWKVLTDQLSTTVEIDTAKQQIKDLGDAAVKAFGSGTQEDIAAYHEQLLAATTTIANLAGGLDIVSNRAVQILVDTGDLEKAVALIDLINGNNVLMGKASAAATASGHGLYIPHRAAGGPVMAGKSYLVGERGPELFTPNSSGGITSNNALSSGTTINVTVNGGDPNSIVRALQQYVRQSGPVPVNTRAM